MIKENGNDRKTRICMELSTYEMPPSGNILVLGKRCALGPNAAKNMLDSVLPDQFEVVNLKDDILDSILVKKHLFHWVDKDILVETIIKEAKSIMTVECMIRIKCEVTVTVEKDI